jgi:hypothetical protein
VRDLMIKIRAFITDWNARKHPFIWTKTPEQILTKINRNVNVFQLRATRMHPAAEPSTST